MSARIRYNKLVVVVKQTAYEEYSALKLRGKAPRALRWGRLKSRYETHNSCVNSVVKTLKNISKSTEGGVSFSVVNRVDFDRQHLQGVGLVIAVGGDGTVLSCSHLLDNGTIPLLGINSDPSTELEKTSVTQIVDERRSYGALCMLTSEDMVDQSEALDHLQDVIFEGNTAGEKVGQAVISNRKRVQCTIKSSYSETKLVPGLNDLLIANPIPAAVSRFRMGSAVLADPSLQNRNAINIEGATRFHNQVYCVNDSINVWSSGIWVCTATGSTAAMAAAGGERMHYSSGDLQYKIREHLVEAHNIDKVKGKDFGRVSPNGKIHLRWNSHYGKIYIDGSHLSHDIQLGDEILIDCHAPELKIFMKKEQLERIDKLTGDGGQQMLC